MNADQLQAEANRQAREGLRGPHQVNTHCSDCKKPFKFGAQEEGAHVYSMAGARDTQIIGVCETCFDEMFGDEE